MGSTFSKTADAGKNLSSSEAKALVQRKICVAEDCPQPEYDLSSCQLRQVPPGTYAKCRVLRKKCLLLQNNLLTCISMGGQISDLGLLTVLRLNNNLLRQLPADLASLKCLQLLDVSVNRLKQLPTAVCQLTELNQLLCCDNQLTQLPAELGQLNKLRRLDVSRNKLTQLPALPNVGNMTELYVSGNEGLQHPPPSLVGQGSQAVIAFLCEELCIIPDTGVMTDRDVGGNVDDDVEDTDDRHDDVTGSGSKLKSQDLSNNSRTPHNSNSDEVERYQAIKDSRHEQLLELERLGKERAMVEEQQLEQQEQLRKQMLTCVAHQQSQFDSHLSQVSQRRDSLRRRMWRKLCDTEAATDRRIERAAAETARFSDPATIMAQLSSDQQRLDQLIAASQSQIKNDTISKHQVAESMVQSINLNTSPLGGATGYIVSHATTNCRDSQLDEKLRELLAARDSQREWRVQQLLEDQQLQQHAFCSLFLQQDSSRTRLLDQIAATQHSLLQLSQVELQQREQHRNQQMVRLCEKRLQLSQLLSQLLQQRAARDQQLQQAVAQLEQQQSADARNYWLHQFQRLLESKPQEIRRTERQMEPAMHRLLVECSAEQFAPVLAAAGVSYDQLLASTTADQLRSLGVSDMSACRKLAAGISQLTTANCSRVNDLNKNRNTAESSAEDESNYRPSAPLYLAELAANQQVQCETGVNDRPSAPPLPLTECASASHSSNDDPASRDDDNEMTQLRVEIECVVCLHTQTEVVFLSCGHACTCRRCSQTLQLCPLCRQSIEHKLLIALS